MVAVVLELQRGIDVVGDGDTVQVAVAAYVSAAKVVVDWVAAKVAVVWLFAEVAVVWLSEKVAIVLVLTEMAVELLAATAVLETELL